MRAIRSAILAFVGVWAFAMLFEAVAYLRLPSPLTWNPIIRGTILFEAVIIAGLAYSLAKIAERR